MSVPLVSQSDLSTQEQFCDNETFITQMESAMRELLYCNISVI